MMKNWLMQIATVGLVAAMALGAVACGDDDDDDDGGDSPTAAATTDDGDGSSADEQAVEDAVQAAFDSWNAKDVDGLAAAFTDAGLISLFGEEGGTETAADVRAGLGEFIGEPPISDPEFSDTSVDGDTATSSAQYTMGAALSAEDYALVKEGDAWLINQVDDGEVVVPAGTTEVNVDLNEFAFGLRTTDITDATGPIALVGNNVGEQEHEMGLARIPADANLDELLRTEEDVPGFEFIGGVGPIEPRDTASLVLTAPLEAGRYVLVCFLPDTAEGSDGEPHAYKGMVSDLTVE